MVSWRVLKGEDGVRLQEFIKEHLKDPISIKEVKRQLEDGRASVNGQIERFGSTKLISGDTVEFHPTTKEKRNPTFDPKRVLYEDNEILIYNKPPKVSSDEKGILALLLPHGVFYLVHRLDKETSGALLLAKTKEALKKLEEAFKERDVEKTYLAVVDGIPSRKKGVIENYLGKVGSFQGGIIIGSTTDKKGDFAKTSWEVKVKGDDRALILCEPETGRTHQIRVHMSEMGHPILGDYLYGKTFSSKGRPDRMLLHAYKLRFLHPKTNEPLVVIAPLPLDFEVTSKRKK